MVQPYAVMGDPQAVKVAVGFTFCPAQIPLTAFATTCGGAPTATGTVTGKIPQELMACKVTLYAPAPVKVNCGSKVVAPVPPVKATDVLPPQAALLAAASQLYRVEQLLGLVLVLSVVLTKGVQPVVGDNVKAGCGGASTQMVRTSVSMPQIFPVTSIMVYVPGVVKVTPRVVAPEIHIAGLAGWEFTLPKAPLADQPVAGLMLQICLGVLQVGA